MYYFIYPIISSNIFTYIFVFVRETSSNCLTEPCNQLVHISNTLVTSKNNLATVQQHIVNLPKHPGSEMTMPLKHPKTAVKNSLKTSLNILELPGNTLQPERTPYQLINHPETIATIKQIPNDYLATK